MVTYLEWKREQENAERLKAQVDHVCREITFSRIKDKSQLDKRVEEARGLCRELFPDRVELFDLVYKSRFLRLWEQFGRGEE